MSSRAEDAIGQAEDLLDLAESRTTTSDHELIVAKATAWATLAVAYALVDKEE